MTALRTHLPDFHLQPQRLAFVNGERISGCVEQDEYSQRYTGIVYTALRAFLDNNKDIRDFVERKKRTLMTIPTEEDIFKDIYEKLISFINAKKSDGREISLDYARDIAGLITESICRVAYFKTMVGVDASY